jgi:hypothetical protein
MKKMKNSIAILSFLMLTSVVCGQTYKELETKANGFYDAKDYTKSVEFYKKAFDETFSNDHKKATPFYNGACSAALAGNNKLAFEWLNTAIDKGWTNISHTKTDTDLTSLHDSKEWQEALDKLQKKLDALEVNYNKPLKAELLAILEEDQKYRQQLGGLEKKYGWDSKEMKDFWVIINKADSLNLIKIKAVLDKNGWVGADKVGNEASNAIFLVIQHSDLPTQQKYLPMMREAVKNKKASGSSLALLEDRVALGEGRKQIYGSQLKGDGNGGYYLSPLEDPDNVDKRREEVGLPPIAEYIQHWNLVWNVEEFKKESAIREAKMKKN